MDKETMEELAEIKNKLRALAIHLAIVLIMCGLTVGLLVGNMW
jgi:hypothetical protein